jgi:hypothetical protein
MQSIAIQTPGDVLTLVSATGAVTVQMLAWAEMAPAWRSR